MKLSLYSFYYLSYSFKFILVIFFYSPIPLPLWKRKGPCRYEFRRLFNSAPRLLLVACWGSWNSNNVESNQVGEVLNFSVSWDLVYDFNLSLSAVFLWRSSTMAQLSCARTAFPFSIQYSHPVIFWSAGMTKCHTKKKKNWVYSVSSWRR